MNSALDTPRLALRPFTEQDVDAWHSIWGDPQVIWWGANETLERSREQLLRLLEHEQAWPAGIGWLAVRRPGADEVIGDVLLQPARFVDGIEIGWHFRSQAWNQGYATEAARAVLERQREAHPEAPVYAIVETSNAPSLRVAEKLGLRAVRDMPHAGLPHRLFVAGPTAG
ncbi:MAG: GNAT family N-acetyltransferase [Planctomycetota bacterium]|nr:GNAT family N-acetyltransferase [Planctomycetota bacterium]